MKNDEKWGFCREAWILVRPKLGSICPILAFDHPTTNRQTKVQ
jgi:hypothetical protein